MDLHRASIQHALSCLHSLRSLLLAAAKSLPPTNILSSRLHEDMLPLSFQIHVVTDLCNKAAHHLTGTEPVALSYDDLTSLKACHDRIDQVRGYLELATREAVEERREEMVHVGLVGPDLPPVDLRGEEYVFDYLVPNLTFHLVVAYSILRKEGVPLGKMDYLGAFVGRRVPGFKALEQHGLPAEYIGSVSLMTAGGDVVPLGTGS